METVHSLNLCGKMHWKELFPSRWTVFVFIAYMAFFINQGLFVTASQQSDNAYGYNTVLAVLLTELTKLLMSIVLYTKDHSVWSLITETRVHSDVMFQYFVPAFLYCLYNNLAFVNLSVFDPTTYYLLLQLRVVITAVLFQILFHRKLSVKQWVSLFVLTAGCMVKQIPFGDEKQVDDSMTDVDVIIKPVAKGAASYLSWNMLLIIVQVVCSCLAGVYNELLLKGQGADCNVYVQNICLYANSIVCNLALLVWQGDITVLLNQEEFNSLMHYKVVLVIINNAAIGIVTSFFLHSLNSILKTFASALELVFTAILSKIFFDIPIYSNTVCAIIIVSVAVFVYSQNPVVNTKPPTKDAVCV